MKSTDEQKFFEFAVVAVIVSILGSVAGLKCASAVHICDKYFPKVSRVDCLMSNKLRVTP